MLGAIIGDIVGSVYEWDNIKTKDFPLFTDECFFTDDTIMTIACAEALMNGATRDHFIDAYKKWGRLYPDASYGSRFNQWIHSDTREPYNSWGNGAPMRVSPCSWFIRGWVLNLGPARRASTWTTEGVETAVLSAEVTHDHPEAIKGAVAVAEAIFMCRYFRDYYQFESQGIETDYEDYYKNEIKLRMKWIYSYDLSRTLDEIRPTYAFDESSQGTVPEAITAFLESTDFEDAIRNAISLGGDSDTLAAIAGSIAEAAYGIPDDIREKVLSYLDEPLLEVLYKWEAFVKKLHEAGA